MGPLEDNSDLIQDDLVLEMSHQVKINQLCNSKITERLCNYTYGSHGELKAYFRLVWTRNFIELVIKEQ